MPLFISLQKPRCPFCDQEISPPREPQDLYTGDFEVGFCPCGAVFVHDATGHNIGAAMVEAMTVACGPHPQMAWDLIPGEDYQEALVEHYDHHLHRIIPTGEWEGRKIRGVLYFVRLREGLRSPGPSNTLKISPSSQISLPKRRRLSRHQLEELINSGQIEKLKALARASTVVLRSLQKVLYSPEATLRWKAVMALAEVAEDLCEIKVSAVGDLVKGLIWASADSAATNWGALEAAGEIISRRPDLFGQFIPNLVAFLKDDTNREAALWALGRIGRRHPTLVRPRAFLIIRTLLEDPDPQIRGHALWALTQMGGPDLKESLKVLLDDEDSFNLFDGQSIHQLKIGQLAKEALETRKG